MRYISNTPAQQREMLATIGAGSIEDLLSRIPTKARLSRPLNVPAAMAETVRRKVWNVDRGVADISQRPDAHRTCGRAWSSCNARVGIRIGGREPHPVAPIGKTG